MSDEKETKKGVERRPLKDFPGYFVGDDKKVWRGTEQKVRPVVVDAKGFVQLQRKKESGVEVCVLHVDAIWKAAKDNALVSPAPGKPKAAKKKTSKRDKPES